MKAKSLICIIAALAIAVSAVVCVALTTNAEDGAENCYFYDQLTPNQRVFYDAMKKMNEDGTFMTGTGSLELTDPDLKLLDQDKARAYMNGSDPSAGSLLNDFAAARDAFYYDWPSVFYVDFSALSIRATSGKDGYHIYIGAGRSDTYYTYGFESKDQVEKAVKEYNDALEKLVGEAKKVETVEGQSKEAAMTGYVHDTLIRSVSYRLEDACKKENIGFIRTAYGALVCHEGVCEAYTRAFKAAMDKLGIPCVMVYGTFMHDSDTPEEHIWNYVRLDGSWYGVDATMDDPISKKDFSELPDGTDGYENRDYFLAGAEIMNKQHYPSGILSAANYEFSYPALTGGSYGNVVETTDSAFSVLVNYNGSDLDDGTTQATVFRISYLGMGAQECINNGYYMLQRNVEVEDETGEIDYGDWNYVLPDVYFFPGDKKEYFETALSYNGFVQFAVTSKAPGDYFNNPYYLTFYGTESELLASTGTLRVSSDYKVPPYPKTVSPSMGTELAIGGTYTMEIEYTEPLKKVNGEEFKIDLECFYYERAKNSWGMYEKRRVDVSEGVNSSKLDDLTWNPAEPNKITFTFKPSEAFAADSVLYSFNVKGLVGEDSEKAPIEVVYGASHPCAVCALKSQGWDWNVFAKPQLIGNQDFSVEDWETSDGEAISEELTHRLTLVTETTTSREDALMEGLIDENYPGDNVKSCETYNIKLTVCKKQVIKTGDSLYISLGFPEGYGPDDAGVTFKAYHFIKDESGNTTGVEEIPCIITEYGLIIKVDSFSPFAIAAVEDNGNGKKVTNVILTSSDGGSVSSAGNDTIYELKNGSSKVSVNADAGFVVDTLTVNGEVIEGASGKASYELTVEESKKDDLGNITVNATFVKSEIRKSEEAKGETAAVAPQATYHEHEWGDYIVDGAGHYRTCKVCGAAEAKTAHAAASGTRPADCTKAELVCEACGEKFALAAEHALTLVKAEGGHYQACSNCDYKTNTVNHQYQTSWSYDGHWRVCRCGAAEATEAHKLVCVNGEDGTHSWKCSDAGCGYTTAVTGHNMEMKHDKDSHWMQCMDCGAVEGKTDHSLEMMFKDSSGHTSICTECGYESEKTAHVLKTQTSVTQHWDACECGYETEKADHVGKDDGDCTTALYCETCKYEMAAAKTHDFSDIWHSISDEKHETVCENEGCTVKKTEEHKWTHDKADDTNHTKRCEVCGYHESEAHTWEIKAVENDQKLMYHLKVCKVCGEDVIEAHTWGEWHEEANGKYSRTCTACGVADKEEEHRWGEWQNNGDGTHSRYCEIHKDQSETAPHVPGTPVKNDDGTHTVSCVECGAVIETVDHTFGAWTDVGDGEHHARRCECGAMEGGEHNWSAVPEDAEDGLHHTFTCSDCGAVKHEQHTLTVKYDEHGHWMECECGYKTNVEKHELVMQHDGNGHWEICDCGYKTDTVKHSFDKCTDNGDGKTHTLSCVCGASVVEDHDIDGEWTPSADGKTHERACGCGYVEKAEHNMSHAHDDEGHWSFCEDCSYKTEKVSHALTSVYDKDGHWPECSDPNCGYKDKSSKKAHEFGYNYDEDGHWNECCCGYRTDAEKHTPEQNVPCDEDVVCTVCGEVVKEAGEHTFKDGVCTVCGAKDPDYKDNGGQDEPKPPKTGDEPIMTVMMFTAIASFMAVGAIASGIVGKKRGEK